MLQFSRLLPSISEGEKQMAKLTRQLDRLLSKNPEKAGGRQVSLADVFARLQRYGGVGRGRVVPSNMHTLIFRRRAAQWARYTFVDRHDYELRARRAAGAKRALLENDIAEVREQRRLLAERLAEDATETPPMLMSSAALNSSQLAMFQRLVGNPAFKNEKKNQRAKARGVGHTATDVCACAAQIERSRCVEEGRPRYA